ncbi:MAG: class I SAM-dependent methyltransferase, partial [Candidatus Kapaibacteriota bacterium]
AEFYKERTDSLRAARQIVPFIVKLLNPKSVVDVGCGTGEFLSVFIEFGIKDVLGIDGEWVPRSQLRIPEDKFQPMNLEKPIFLGRKFDLVVSLEVAEHLSPNSTPNFIDFLTSLGNIILFSAAIPGQGGLNHINERWQEDWKNLFEERGYVLFDAIRKQFWYNPNVCFWYKQNAFLYINKEIVSQISFDFIDNNTFPLNVVHFELFEKKVKELERIYKYFPQPLVNLFKAIKRLFS